MANTRTAAKRALQSKKRQARNSLIRSSTRTTVKKAFLAITNQDLEKAKTAYPAAVKALDSAASKGVFPKGRTSRKISRLTLLAKKVLPDLLKSKTQ